MSGYEADHNLPQFSATPERPARRLDLSTFYSNLNQIDDSRNNTATQPHPSQLSSLYRQAANAYQVMNGETEGVYTGDREAAPAQQNELLQYMIETLMSGAEEHLTHTQGVPQDFLDKLDRVSKAELQRRAEKKTGDTCPICTMPFLDDKYPLVVRLPCHPEHIFDLDCVQPWLKLNVTCPLDRKELLKVESDEVRLQRLLGKKPGQAKQTVDDEDEDDVDGMYG